jgi:ankyrin repeat protein
LAFAIFLKLGLDIDFRDKRLSTPLHWAAFAGSETVLNFILSKNPEIDF